MPKRLTSRTLARNIAKSAAALKAVDISILNLSGLCSFTDYFVIMSGTSSRHVQSIADRIVRDRKMKREMALGIEGYDRGEWVLIDYGSVVVHVFHPEARKFYSIEKLWGDAKRVVFKGIA